jgi:hypothetical protein
MRLQPIDVWLLRQWIRQIRGMVSAADEWVKRTAEQSGPPSEELK